MNEQLNEDLTLFNKYTGLNTTLLASIIISKDEILQQLSHSYPITVAVTNINTLFTNYGVPKKSLLSNDEFVVAFLTVIVTLGLYYVIMGKNHGRKRKRLAADLKIAQDKVNYLQEKLNLIQQNISNNHHNNTSSSSSSSTQGKKEIRLFIDGAFDMMHYGHMNAFRLARSLGTHLIVGVNSDESITQCKGPPLMNDSERLIMVQGCKFVDEVIPNCPYIMNEEYVNYILTEHNVDYIIHGDDPCIVDGKDVYETAKKMGKFQSIPRTEGVSTTDIVGRMLLMNKSHHHNHHSPSLQPLCHNSKFLTTSRLLKLFSGNMKSPEVNMKVIYVDGAFDMFHPGHVSMLEAAKKRGDYLIVGVHSDALVNQERGSNLPLMNLHERVLSVLGCRFVDDVLIDAPQVITHEMISSLHINEVVHGVSTRTNNNTTDDDGTIGPMEKAIRYKYAKEAGIYVEIPIVNDFNFSSILERIQENQVTFTAKIRKKKKAEEMYYSQKYATSSKGSSSSSGMMIGGGSSYEEDDPSLTSLSMVQNNENESGCDIGMSISRSGSTTITGMKKQ